MCLEKSSEASDQVFVYRGIDRLYRRSQGGGGSGGSGGGAPLPPGFWRKKIKGTEEAWERESDDENGAI